MNLYATQERKINEFKTPLLVPSFSSKGFSNIGDLHDYLKDSLGESSLISAYDLHYGFIQHDKIFETDIVFVDSGGYERNKEHDLSEIYGEKHIPRLWNQEKYREEVSKIEPITNIILVNYDFHGPKPLNEQVESAKNDFSNYPTFMSDFLCKPISEGQMIDINDLIDKIHLMSDFNILGLTEKELGRSILDRCTNIYKLRLALNKVNMNMPIHIFGCLDPLNIITYFLCGADIFDGLSWLRFAFDGESSEYINSHTISKGKWNIDDLEARFLIYADNLQQLFKLKQKMIEFIETGDMNVFDLSEDSLEEIIALMKRVHEAI